MSGDIYWAVAIDAPLPNPLTYSSGGLAGLQRGLSVVVPLGLGAREVRGVLLKLTIDTGEYIIKPILRIDEERPVLPEFFLAWLEWVASYYLYPIGEVIESAFPPLSKFLKRPHGRKPRALIPNVPFAERPHLTAEQEMCLKELVISEPPAFATHLLFGVTGSGKTEVYLRLIEQVIAAGRQVIFLVPEISLTPQLIQRFAARFGDAIAVIHSQLSTREKTTQWWAMVDRQKSILIGARSALFCPLANLGMIVVDEEHEPSFKQDEHLRYNARDIAIMLAKLANCPVILGSATPSLESWQNAQINKYTLHSLTKRVLDRALPTIEIVDLREQQRLRKKGELPGHLPFWLSHKLYEELALTLGRGKQSALFINRRGVAQFVLCPACGYSLECPNCAVSLTLHGKKHLVCHYCDYHETLREKCPSCREGDLTALGMGTELVENDVTNLFPAARIARADRDEIVSRQDMERFIQLVENDEVDILIGTQMIAKGLDFKNLDLVGLVLADVGFNLPDFRASERSFQIITQMSGRSGRHIEPGKDPGKVIVQTYNPQHISVQYAKNHDYIGFAEKELSYRKELNYPPFGRLTSIRTQGQNLDSVRKTLRNLTDRATQLVAQQDCYRDIELLGPAQAPLAKLKNKYRYNLLIKSAKPAVSRAFCQQMLGDKKWIVRGTQLIIDVDPLNLL